MSVRDDELWHIEIIPTTTARVDDVTDRHDDVVYGTPQYLSDNIGMRRAAWSRGSHGDSIGMRRPGWSRGSHGVEGDDELRHLVQELQRINALETQMPYLHGTQGGYNLNDDHSTSMMAELSLWFLGDARRVRELYWDGNGDFGPSNGRRALALADIALRCVGEVVFIDSTWSSLVMLVCLLIQDWYATVLTVAFLIITTALTMTMSVFPRKLVGQSLYGYNTVLVSIAMTIFAHDGTNTPFTTKTFASVVVGNVINFLFVCFFRMSDGLASFTFTFPFNLASMTYLMSGTGVTFSALQFTSGAVRVTPWVAVAPPTNATSPGVVLAMSLPNSFGQVFFVELWPLGLAMWASCALHSPTLAWFAFLGALSGSGGAMALGVDYVQVATGLWGFNTVLVAMLVGLTWTPDAKNPGSIAWHVRRNAAAVVLSLVAVFLTSIERHMFTTVFGVGAFTMPFCTAATLYVTILSSPLMKEDTVLIVTDAVAAQQQLDAQQ